MNSRLLATLFSSLALTTAPALAQEHPVRRVATIVSVAVEEYARGVDAKGKLISALEYQEATDFLADAHAQAARLAGERAATRALLDTIIAAVRDKLPPDSVKVFEQRFAASLGSEGALEQPTKATDVNEGAGIYARSCASCHGPRGMGDDECRR